MADELRTEVEQVKNQTDVKQALKRTTGTEVVDARDGKCPNVIVSSS